MDGDALLEKSLELVKKIPRSAYLSLALCLIGFVFLIIGLIQLLKQSPAKQDGIIETVSTTPSQSVTIEVDVEGAVQNPGVYHLQSNARLQDALIASGGLSASADRQYIAQKMNLASKLADGSKIYVPNTADVATQQPITNNQLTNQTFGAQTGLIDINSASAQDLDSLPGVGLVTAQKIINGRPYSSIDDLLTRKIVSQKVYGEIKDKVVAN